MIVLSRNVSIPDNELEITAIRAQGAGGQHVNKASTAIHLRFDIRASSLPEYYKARLLAASQPSPDHQRWRDCDQSPGIPQPGAQPGSGDRQAGGGHQRINGSTKKPPGNAANPRIERASVVLEGPKIHSESTTR